MSVSSISGSLTSIYQSTQAGAASRGQGGMPPGGVQGGRPPGSPPGGGMDKAVMQSLAEALGVSATSATTATGSTTPTDSATSTASVEDAFGSFMQSLMTALRAQGSESEPGEGGQQVRGHHGHGGGPGRMEADLQSLIASLADTSSTDDGTGTAASATGSEESSLQDSFDNLLSALGASTDNSSATLNSFLQSLQGKLADVRPQGNVVDTTA